MAWGALMVDDQSSSTRPTRRVDRNQGSSLGFAATHAQAVVCSSDLLKKLHLQPDVVHKPSEAFVDLGTHVEHE